MRLLLFLFIFPLLFSCSVSKNYNPNKKYSGETLREDYTFLRNVLEKKHPSLYWYTPKDSMDYFFDEGYKAINDSMTELQFGWKIIAPLTATIHCGHTSFSMSRGWNNFIKNKRIPSFPLNLKIWSDTMVVVNNLNRKDSLIKRGTIITSINGLKGTDMVSRMFDFMVEDGYSDNVNYIRLSASFPYFHRNIFGLYKTYNVGYVDSTGVEKNITLPFFVPPADSLGKRKKNIPGIKEKKFTRRERLANIRSLQIDTSTAIMTINSFSKAHLHHFFKSSFRRLKEEKIQNLIIDIRANGGGDIDNYVLLTKFLRNAPFKVADTAYAMSKSFRPYTSHITSGFFNNLGLLFVTHKKKDGKYHFGFWERHTFMPKRSNHFEGQLYVLTNGLTFSASSLFCNAVKGQDNVTLVGEQTGGGWYGNSGIMIPDIILPKTKLHVRIPFFRLVQYHHIAVKGTGVIPDIYVGPNVKDVIGQVDTKMETVREMIAEKDLKIKN
ncbi:MAG TPA: S41 family peptidase [Chitinophagaceae bacterium]|nr:S41 family peptidase [Chitinophagaceae bacterium]